MREKIEPYESLRGIAALAVALFHLRCNSILNQNSFIQNADLMVDFFFVLSGFVIAFNYLDRITKNEDLWSFQRKRFWRLYPLHLVTLIVFLGIECAKYVFEQKSGTTSTFPAFSESNLSAFLQQLGLAHALIDNSKTFNYPSWSISTEFYTYFLFGCIVLGLKKHRIAGFLILLVIGFGFRSGFLSLNNQYFPMFRCMYSFFLGVMGWIICRRLKTKLSGMGWISLGLIGISIWSVSNLELDTVRNTVCPLIFFVLIITLYLTPKESSFYKVLSLKPLTYLGTISYSIYMTHAAFWWVTTQILRFVAKVPTKSVAGQGTYIELEPIPAIALTVLGLVCIVGVSHLTYQWIENPFRKGIPKLIKPIDLIKNRILTVRARSQNES